MKTGYSFVAVLVLAALAVAAVEPAVRAQTAPAGAGSIAILDVPGVIRRSKAVQTIGQQVEKLRAEFTAERQRKERALRKEDQDLARQRVILSPEAFSERRREFERRTKVAQREVQGRKRNIERLIARAMREVNSAMLTVTAELAKERALSFVLDKQAVILAPRRLDISPEVLKRLDKRLPSVTLGSPKTGDKPGR
jgi:outer membrane protein